MQRTPWEETSHLLFFLFCNLAVCLLMLCLSTKSKNGVHYQKCKNKQRRNTSLMTFEQSNLINNCLVELKEDFSGPEFPVSGEVPLSSDKGVQIMTKIFKISTQNHGYSRIVKVYEIKVGNQVIKVTDMYTNLPKEMNDAYNEMVQAQTQDFPEQLDFKVVLLDSNSSSLAQGRTPETERSSNQTGNQLSEAMNSTQTSTAFTDSQTVFQGTSALSEVFSEGILPEIKQELLRTNSVEEETSDQEEVPKGQKELFKISKKVIRKGVKKNRRPAESKPEYPHMGNHLIYC